ncbi:MAG TPA: SCP2 sterol-binding domain-containing protein [Thermodesulfobacteriota bacterium]|nr:SCP2 sterol-binding domain-containing protein [Thermodesulfobacteriota bacterium]
MVKLEEHPTVKHYKQRVTNKPTAPLKLDADWLRKLCLEAGADDVGFVEIDRSEIDGDRKGILAAFPHTETLISIVCRMNRESIRSPFRSIANTEFHEVGDHVNEVCHSIVSVLEAQGIRALNPAMGFPMEMDRWEIGKTWTVSHKLVAVAAGLGKMGIHRNVIHPKFGSFILLGTILVEAEVTDYEKPIDYNPCVECKLCVAACPTGAIAPDGYFNFSACYTHNYREFMGGFVAWVENIAGSKDARDYRSKVSDAETVSMWQSLSYGANYKAAYCIAVCPAGEDVIGPFLDDRKNYLKDVVRPFQEKEETVYVVPNSDAEAYVARRFPHKITKQVSNGFRPTSIKRFLQGLPLAFQRDKAEGLDATYHFTFTGKEACKATIAIRNRIIQVHDGHVGTADLHVTADSRTWLKFLMKETNILWALIRRKIRIKGLPRLLKEFGKCFPS